MGKTMHYERFIEAPELAQICLSCECPNCECICDRFKAAWKEYNGIITPNNTENEKKREKVEYVYQKKWTYNGETHSLREWANIAGMSYNTLHMRMWKYGMSFEEAIKRPKKAHNRQYDVLSGMTVNEIAKKYGIPVKRLYRRLELGYSMQDAVSMPKMSIIGGVHVEG